MDTEVIIELHPDNCGRLGLDCHSCTARAARDVAALCANLAAARLEATFFRMFSQPACASMLPSFVESYFEATEPDLSSLMRLSVATVAA